MFSKKLLIPLLSLSLLVTPAYSSHAAENTEAVETSVEGQGMLSSVYVYKPAASDGKGKCRECMGGNQYFPERSSGFFSCTYS